MPTPDTFFAALKSINDQARRIERREGDALQAFQRVEEGFPMADEVLEIVERGLSSEPYLVVDPAGTTPVTRRIIAGEWVVRA